MKKKQKGVLFMKHRVLSVSTNQSCHDSSATSKLIYAGLGCVHIDTSMSTSPGFRLQLIEASLVRVERSRSLLQAHN